MATKQVLIVDDDEPCRTMAQRILSRGGFEVDTAGNGEEGLEMAAGKKFDLILLDVMMPEMNGYELCRRMRDTEANAETPVVMVSALDSLNDMAKAAEAGALWYVNKPYDSRYLLSVVHHRTSS